MAAKTSAYKGNTAITGEQYVHSYTPDEVIEFHKCFNDPDYFIRKYVKIVTLDNGIQPFELYDFQGDMIEKAHNNRFSVFLTARQMGKTTTIGGYLLHAGLFNSNYVIGILANKGSQSKEILSRIKEMYERLPKFLQQGVAEWNKYSVILGNGTEIFAAATSSSSIRGKSVNILYLDEFGFVPNADEFWTSTYPVITGGKTTKVIITSTPNGLNLFHKIFSDAVKGRNGFVYLEVLWHHHPDRDERWKEETISKIGAQKFAQEYECVHGDTEIELMDSDMDVVFKTTIGDLYNELSCDTESFIIYKLDRDDGSSYIGQCKTNRFKIRMNTHAKSKRFEDHTFIETILGTANTLTFALLKEQAAIFKYDTYKNGLNLTKTGGHISGSDKFNTLGYKFSDKSKKKMSESQKKVNRLGTSWGSHSKEQKEKWSKNRKGTPARKPKASAHDVYLFLDCNEYVDRHGITRKFGDILPSGHVVTKEIIVKHLLASKYNQVPNNFTKLVRSVLNDN